MAKAQAEIDLIRHKRDRAVLRSPLKGKGIVLTGDLKRQIGAPVKKGDVLFEVAPVAAIRAVLSVPEDMIADVREADAKAKTHGERARGELATASQPDRHVRFELEHITPVAEVVEQKNVFKVRVKLLESTAAELSQGMEGAARITIDRRRYAWIWSRRLVNWVRMKLWF